MAKAKPCKTIVMHYDHPMQKYENAITSSNKQIFGVFPAGRIQSNSVSWERTYGGYAELNRTADTLHVFHFISSKG